MGGNKKGKGRWYKELAPIADRLYDRGDNYAACGREVNLSNGPNRIPKRPEHKPECAIQ
jgi:hypothetical protein